MKILVFGGNGMLGHKLVDCWRNKFDVWTTIREHYDSFQKYELLPEHRVYSNINVEDISAFEKILKKLKPDVIVNAIGIIKQLETSKDVVNTLTINSIFPHRLAQIAKQFNIRLISFSTDCVFNGSKGNYIEDDKSDAEDIYGKSKNLGEVTSENCLTLRTSIIGRELKTSHSLVEWFLSRQDKTIKGFKNAIFTGFPTIILAELVTDIIINYKKMQGLYHISSQPISKFELLQLLKKYYQVDIEIEPFEGFVIDRSLNSARFRAETKFQPESWEKMINKMVCDPFPYNRMRK